MSTGNCEDGDCGKDNVTVAIDSSKISSCVDGSSCIRLGDLYADPPLPIPNDTPESSLTEVARKLSAETLGTGILLTVIVGSGIMAETLSPTDVGLQLLENGISVGLGLVGLILVFGPVSGAHFNPVVSLVDYLHGDMSLQDLAMYTVAQVVGAILGTLLFNAQFDVPDRISTKERDDSNLWLGEIIGTVTLLMIIHGCIRTGQKSYVPFAVGGWVTSGHFFTSSTIFANPAVTIGRQFSNTFTGIDPNSVGQFIGFQFLGALIAWLFIKWFFPENLSLRKDDNLYMRLCVQSTVPYAVQFQQYNQQKQQYYKQPLADKDQQEAQPLSAVSSTAAAASGGGGGGKECSYQSVSQNTLDLQENTVGG